jgi:cyclohexanecarboxylate-CoA ligase
LAEVQFPWSRRSRIAAREACERRSAREADQMTLRIDFAPDRVAYYRAQGWWTDELIGDWLARAARLTPDQAAIVHGGRAVTFAELARLVRAFARGLDRLGIAKGDVVAVQLPNVLEFVVAYIGLASRGAVMQTLHMPYRAAEIENLLAHSGAAALICVAQHKDYAAAALGIELKSRLPRLAHVIAVGGAPQGTIAFDDLVADALQSDADPAPVTVTAADPFVLLYTSGTTAAPKGVPHPACTYLANFRLVAEEIGITSADTVFCAAPFTHLYGLSALSVALSGGATSILLPAFTPQEFADALRRTQPSVIYAGPAHMTGCLNAGLITARDLSRVRCVLLSGAAVSPELAEAIESALDAGEVLQLWGMTELQAGAFTRLGESREVRTHTAGRPVRGNELRVMREDGLPAAPDEVGELEMRGCSLFAGYLGNPEATAAAFTADGWFRTGDLASLDASGNLRIAGRTKEIINRGGVKFNPLDVEYLMVAHPAVEMCAIIPMPDPVLGERACCFVTLRPGRKFAFEEMQAWLAQHALSKVKWPERLEIIDAMPMTPTRKVMKGELVRELERRRQRDQQQQ